MYRRTGRSRTRRVNPLAHGHEVRITPRRHSVARRGTTLAVVTAAMMTMASSANASGGNESSPSVHIGTAVVLISTCPDTPLVITSSIRLANDLTCALRVDAPDVSVDLYSHTLLGRVFSSQARVTVHSGVVDGGGSVSAVSLLGVENRIEGVEVRNTTGFSVQPGPRTVIMDSRFVNAGVAIDLYYGGGVTVERSTFTGNRIGVNIASDNASVIRNNHFTANDRGVRIWDEDRFGAARTTLANNVFDKNSTGAEILARCDAKGTLVTKNAFLHSSGPGLEVSIVGDGFGGASCQWGAGTLPGAGTILAGNRFVSNGGSGALYVHGVPAALAGVTLTGNTAVGNAALGFDAVGASDGGRNRANNNGDPLECAGIAC